MNKTDMIPTFKKFNGLVEEDGINKSTNKLTINLYNNNCNQCYEGKQQGTERTKGNLPQLGVSQGKALRESNT